MRVRSVGVSSMPGFTKVMQEVILDKNIRLLDSPGIVFADGDSSATALRNCVNIEELEDVLTPIQAVLEKCPQQYLMQLYSIPRFQEQDCTSFLALVARNTGRLKKGGIPNIDAAARAVLHDWNSGRIKYYCKAPRVMGVCGGAGERDSAVLSSFSAEFSIEDMLADERRILDTLDSTEDDGNADYVAMDEIAGSTLDTDILAEDKVGFQSSTVSKKKTGSVAAKIDPMDEDATAVLGTTTSRKSQKADKKKAEKQKKKIADLQDYDFTTDYA